MRLSARALARQILQSLLIGKIVWSTTSGAPSKGEICKEKALQVLYRITKGDIGKQNLKALPYQIKIA